MPSSPWALRRQLYFFRHTPNSSLNWDARSIPYFGAFHGAEVPFAFGDQSELSDDAERALSLSMGCYWRNFIHHGDPNANDGKCVGGVRPPAWPRYEADASSQPTLMLDVGGDAALTPVNDFKQAQCDMFAAHRR